MTILRMSFTGEAKRVDNKSINGKALIEVSLCKKHKGRNGGEDTFSWIKASIWEAPDFMVAKLVKGAFIAGSGEYQLRSYEKDGVKGHSAEVRCSSFDVEVCDGQPRQPTTQGPVTTPAQRSEPKVNIQMSAARPFNPMLDDEPPL